jgi:hypothetical protein
MPTGLYQRAYFGAAAAHAPRGRANYRVTLRHASLTCSSMCCSRAGERLQFLEVSSQAMALAGDLGARVAKSGGAALIVDYGRDAPYAASLQVRPFCSSGLLHARVCVWAHVSRVAHVCRRAPCDVVPSCMQGVCVWADGVVWPLPAGALVPEHCLPACRGPPSWLMTDCHHVQAIRSHGFVDMLSQPGLADLSARVDFSALRCLSSWDSHSAAKSHYRGSVLLTSYIADMQGPLCGCPVSWATARPLL